MQTGDKDSDSASLRVYSEVKNVVVEEDSYAETYATENSFTIEHIGETEAQ